MGSLNFVHLTTHSTFSLLEGAMQLDQILNIAKEDEQPAIALTDYWKFIRCTRIF